MGVLTQVEARALLKRLDGEPADLIESEMLECKPWDQYPAARDSHLRDLREAVVCLANSRGGDILLGIADKKRTRQEAIQGVGPLDVADLRRRVYDGTDPHILVEIEEILEPEGRLLLIRVPRGIPPHTTTEGVGKIRIGKECRPLKGSDLSRLLFAGGERDLTAELIPGATVRDLDEEAVRDLPKRINARGERHDLAGLGSDEILTKLELVREGEITLSAILLLGRSTALAKWAPQHEVVYVRFTSKTRYGDRRNLRGPILSVLATLEGLIAPHVQLELLQTEGFEEITIRELTWRSVREAILNAVVHRDYFLRQPVQIELHADRLAVSSPGGFIGGVTPENVLRHVAVRRNPFLAETLERLNLVNRVGVGVRRIYEDMLRLGKAMPKYEADEGHVRVLLPMATNPSFARFAAEEARAGRKLEIDDLIALRALADRGQLDRWSAAKCLQLEEEEAALVLASLRGRGYLVAHGRGRGTGYRLARQHSDLLRGAGETDRDIPLDAEAVRLRVQAVLAERGRLTNADVQRISGYSRTEVLRLLRAFTNEGLAILKGRGRGAHYVPGPKLPSRKPGRGKS